MDKKHEIKEDSYVNQYVRPEFDFWEKYLIYIIIWLVLWYAGLLLVKPELFTYLTTESMWITTAGFVGFIIVIIILIILSKLIAKLLTHPGICPCYYRWHYVPLNADAGNSYGSIV